MAGPIRRRGQRIVTGVELVDLRLARLTAGGANKIVRPELSRALTQIVKSIKAAVPKTARSVRKSIGKRNTKSRHGIHEAKAGIDVGKRKNLSAGKVARSPHAHLVALGTKPRWTGALTRKTKKGGVRTRLTGKRRAFRGRMPANAFVARAWRGLRSRVYLAMQVRVLRRIDAELRK